MIIEVDEYKKQIPGYDPEKSEEFHSESGKLADKDFEKQVRSGNYHEIIFMAGGTASGKSEFAQTYLTEPDVLVYDGTLKNLSGFEIKVRNIIRYAPVDTIIRVILILPQDLEKSFSAFLTRERKMENKTFFETHIKSKINVAKLLEKREFKNRQIYCDVYVSFTVNNESDLEFEKIKYSDHNQLIQGLYILAKEYENKAQELGIDLDINYDMI